MNDVVQVRMRRIVEFALGIADGVLQKSNCSRAQGLTDQQFESSTLTKSVTYKHVTADEQCAETNDLCQGNHPQILEWQHNSRYCNGCCKSHDPKTTKLVLSSSRSAVMADGTLSFGTFTSEKL